MQPLRIEITRDGSNDNRWAASRRVNIANGYPKQHRAFVGHALIGSLVGTVIVAVLAWLA